MSPNPVSSLPPRWNAFLKEVDQREILLPRQDSNWQPFGSEPKGLLLLLKGRGEKSQLTQPLTTIPQIRNPKILLHFHDSAC
jgi:hypothetical protein